MAWKFSTAVRNARLDATEVAIGTSPQLIFYSGAAPASPAAAATGTVLATMALPSDWMSNASGGVKGLLGTWQDSSADAGGTLGYCRIYDTPGTTCHGQGTVTATGGGGEITVATTAIAATQPFTITAFTFTEGNG